MDYRELVPAYGRDYKNQKSVAADFAGGKDFRDALTGAYCSIRDFAKGAKLLLRYSNLRRVVIYAIK